MVKDEALIKQFLYNVRLYDRLNKAVVMSMNSMKALMPQKKEEHDEIIPHLKKLRKRQARELGRDLKLWTIWTEWLVKVPGIGENIASHLILLYYYKFIPVCKKCGADLLSPSENGGPDEFLTKCPNCTRKAKKDGLLKTRVEFRDFRQPSSWWKFLGIHTVNGVKPMRKKGQKSDWSNIGRMTCYLAGDQFGRQSPDHPYKAKILKAKENHLRKNEDRDKPWAPLRIDRAGRNEAVKLFTSHFWHVAREIAGKPTTTPWIIAHGGHTGIIPPYYWEPLDD